MGEALSPGVLAAASDAVRAAGAEPLRLEWLDAGEAADLVFTGGQLPFVRQAVETAIVSQGDVVVQPARPRRRRLLVADMDSTMITVECIDELADHAGLKAEVAAITERAMQGDLDFAASLTARVALLAGLSITAIADVLRDRVRLTPGARTLVQTMRAHGGRAVLVSGGFTAFAEPVGAEIGFDRVVANQLEVHRGSLTGRVVGDIVGAETKRDVLFAEMGRLSERPAGVLAVGDGANDIPMLQAAGLGIAYRAKPKAAAAAAAAIRQCDLTALLWAQGYRREEWAG